MTLIAEKDGVPIGFFGLVPDFNSVLQHMNGKLNPVTIAKALYLIPEDKRSSGDAPRN